MKRILRLDGQLTQLLAGFDKVAKSIPFEPLGDLLKVERETIQFKGLYFIEIRVDKPKRTSVEAWMAGFKSAWDQDEFKQCFVPSCQKARMKKNEALQEWMPLYLGKAKKVGNRIWEHLYLEKDKRTFALKLKARNLLAGNRFRLSVLRLPDVQHYDVLAPKLEAALRNKLHPLVGRQ
jgi:hypothetical protein